jgi:hypothetical protein
MVGMSRSEPTRSGFSGFRVVGSRCLRVRQWIRLWSSETEEWWSWCSLFFLHLRILPLLRILRILGLRVLGVDLELLVYASSDNLVLEFVEFLEISLQSNCKDFNK